ncbi:MAG: hypothetical protein ACM3JP_02310 [Betaproteobacteria bacterium]
MMTAIGGFVDIGNLVTSGITGARFGMALAWAIVVGTIGMTLYGEMAGRVAAVGQRPVFRVIRERLGVRASLVNLVAFALLSVFDPGGGDRRGRAHHRDHHRPELPWSGSRRWRRSSGWWSGGCRSRSWRTCSESWV